MSTRIIPLLALALLLAASMACHRERPASEADFEENEAATGSEIWHDLNAALITDSKLNANEPDDPAEIRTRVYSLPYHVAESLLHMAVTDSPADPFDPVASRRLSATAEERLKELGVDFPAGTSAVFSEKTSELIITHDLPHLSKCEEILNNWDHNQNRVINHRIEVFQLPAALTIEISDSAARNSDHRPEWEAVNKLVLSHDASVVAGISASSGSGQRCRVLAADEFIFVADYSKDEKTGLLEPVFETREIGTILELDCVLGTDGESINVNFVFEYHSAPPGEETVAFRYPDSNRSTQIQAPVFHAHKIQTEITTRNGHVILIGSWRPTGKAEFETEDVMQIAFLKSDVHTVGGVQRLR